MKAESLVIRNIRRGTGDKAQWIYAELYDADGQLLICATLDHIVNSIHLHHLPQTRRESVVS